MLKHTGTRRCGPGPAARMIGFLALLASLPGCTGDGDGGARDAALGADASGIPDSAVGSGTDAGDNAPERWLALDGVVNARDLGGYAVSGGQSVRWRQLLRGGALSGLTSTGCAAFTALGVTTVIDLREATEQASAPPPACVTESATVVSTPMPKILPASADNYLALMDQSEAAVVQMFATVGQAHAGPVYVHCVIGRDRASWAAALLLLAVGADRATVLTDFLLSNDAGVTVTASHLEAILDAIDAAGGIEAYLTGLGVTQEQLSTLRGWALE